MKSSVERLALSIAANLCGRSQRKVVARCPCIVLRMSSQEPELEELAIEKNI